MALVVEDGTGLPNADSYKTLVEIREYAVSRGVTLSSDDAVVETQARVAFDHLNGYGDRFKGNKGSATQSGQWPRTGVVIQGFTIPEDELPTQLGQAQCELINVQSEGVDLSPVGDSARVIEEQVGPIRTKFSETRGAAEGQVPTIPAVENLLQALLRTTAFGGSFTTIRV